MLFLVKDLEQTDYWWHETKKDLIRWAQELADTDCDMGVNEAIEAIENYQGHDYEVELVAQ